MNNRVARDMVFNSIFQAKTECYSGPIDLQNLIPSPQCRFLRDQIKRRSSLTVYKCMISLKYCGTFVARTKACD